MPKTIFEKIWDLHMIRHQEDGSDLLHVDRCYVHDLSGPPAFRLIRKSGRVPMNRNLIFNIPDHTLSSRSGREITDNPISAANMPAFRRAAEEYGIRMFDLGDPRQGVVHVVGPEQGLTLPGMTVVCGDSHTCTNGAMGAMAWGIGTSELYHVIATQSILVRKPKQMRIYLTGRARAGTEAMDVILYLISKLGAGFGAGYAVEYTGEYISSLEIEDRLTICNLTVEMGSEYALIAPDAKTFAYILGKPYAPEGEIFEAMRKHALSLTTDPNAVFDREEEICVSEIRPQISWGVSPEQTIALGDCIPRCPEHRDMSSHEKALAYMDYKEGMRMSGQKIDRVFIGSCSNGRISNLRRVAAVVNGKHVANHVEAWIVPGSEAVRAQAEAEGLADIFRDAGFMWGSPGCSLCGGCNTEHVGPGQHCVSTSNRNFMGRQGPGARTHLAAPVTAAMAAIEGFVPERM